MSLRIIYFTSPGCSVCVHQTAVLNEIESEIDIEIENHLITTAFDKALSFGVKSAPAMVFVQDGRTQLIKTGFVEKSKIRDIYEMLTESEN